MKDSIKPYSKDISEVHRAFYKSTKDYLIPAWCIKQKMDWYATVLREVIYFIILTDLTEFSVEVLCG